MASLPRPPRSPSLEPPRKSVELEDPGAHELSGSENEDDHFSDAQEGRNTASRPSSPIPTTRVEKVDDRENYGEVPGTSAYKLREQDAVPDELEVVPEGSRSRSRPASLNLSSPPSPARSIPKTVVEKVDPHSPSHGEVPGTPAHAKRMADAVPDVVRSVGQGSHANDEGRLPSQPGTPVPTTVLTKVDSIPSHGEVPGTSAYDKRREDAEPDAVEKKGDVKGATHRSLDLKRPKLESRTASSIAADGGFGPMEADESEEEESEKDDEKKSNLPLQENFGEEEEEPVNNENDFGEDFDDFEAGGQDEDFGDFDEGVSQADEDQIPAPTPAPVPQIATIDSPFSLLDFSDLDTLDEIRDAMTEHLDAIFPSTKQLHDPPAPIPPSHQSVFLTERSLSLWTQLVAPPPLQPPNWVRSRIRRLFLVSLGVPVDLDEILPASKQKRLILPSTELRSRSVSPADGRRPDSKARPKHPNASSTSIDRPQSRNKSTRSKKKGPPAAPELDVPAAKLLCNTTSAALSNMTDAEVRAHVESLEQLTKRASEVLEYWLKQRESALGDKEVFEGVIENLVKHARKVRQ